MNKQLYGRHGYLNAVTGKGDELRSILVSASKLMLGTSFCRMYMVSEDAENPDRIWVTEVWKSKEAHQSSLKDPEVLALIQRALPILDGSPEKGQEFHVIPETING